MSVTFDTLAYVQRLRQAGFTPEQAEGQAQALGAAMSEAIATKQDLRELETRLTAAMDTRFAALDTRVGTIETRLAAIDGRLAAIDGRFAAIDGRLAAIDGQFAAIDTRFTKLELRLTLRLGALMVTTSGVVAALAKFL